MEDNTQQQSKQHRVSDRVAAQASQQVSRLAHKKIRDMAAKQAATSGVKAAAGAASTPQGRIASIATSQVLGRVLKVKPGEEDTAKGATKQLVHEVASGAAEGAVTASAPGAAVGAAKGFAVGVLGNRKLRTTFTILLVTWLLTPVMMGAVGVLVAASITANAQSAQHEQSLKSVESYGVEAEEVNRTTERLQAGYDQLPWSVVLAADHKFAGATPPIPEGVTGKRADALAQHGWDIVKFETVLNIADPQRVHRALTGGAMRDGSGVEHLVVFDPNDPDEAAFVNTSLWERHTATKTVIVDALIAAGISEVDAQAIYNVALEWELGVIRSCATDTLTSSSSGGGRGSTVDTFSATQVRNAHTIIGVAKSMFGEKWRQAATIGVMTAMQESMLTVYANDGVIDQRERARFDEYPEASYTVIARSVEVPHDAVGSDFTSLGIFQQNFHGGWSKLGDRTSENDPNGAMRRLMDPVFASYAFFRALKTIPGWESMDPVAASHQVQVSANPEAPRKHLPEAERAVTTYDDAPAIQLPEEDGGHTPDTLTACPNGAGFPGVITGGWAHPLGGEHPWTTYPGSRSHNAGAIDFPMPEGTPIYAIGAGTVVNAGRGGPYGNWVTIQHPNGYSSLYAHMVRTPVVRSGQVVQPGQLLGHVGNTGVSSGNHLHFEVMQGPPAGFQTVKTFAFMAQAGITLGPCVEGPCNLAGYP